MGYELDQTGIKPIQRKIQKILDKIQPQTLKQLRSYLGEVNQFNRFVLDLAKLCYPFRNLLKKETEWKWGREHEKAFVQVIK